MSLNIELMRVIFPLMQQNAFVLFVYTSGTIHKQVYKNWA